MAVDMNLVADIRASVVQREVLLTITRGESTIRAWSGRGELTVDGETYGGTSEEAIIAISGISDTLALQSHEVQIAINMQAAREISQDGFSLRGASCKVQYIFMANDGSIREFRKTAFLGTIQTTLGNVSIDSEGALSNARPPLMNMQNARLTRYTPADQSARFQSQDIGFNDVPGLINKAPSEWTATSVAGGVVINVGWSIDGGNVVLTDTSGRDIDVIGSAQLPIPIECGSTDRLGFVDGFSSTESCSAVFNHAGHTGYLPSVEYVQFGYGATVGKLGNHVASIPEYLLDFVGVELNVDGFVYADGQRVVVSQSDNRVYSHDGYAIVKCRIVFVSGYLTDGGGGRSPDFDATIPIGPICTDFDQSVDAKFVHGAFDANVYLEAQAV
jgi:hypothetical protein